MFRTLNYVLVCFTFVMSYLVPQHDDVFLLFVFYLIAVCGYTQSIPTGQIGYGYEVQVRVLPTQKA